MTLGGLFSKKTLPEITGLKIPDRFKELKYRDNFTSFGVDEKYVESYLIDLMRDELGWKKVQKKHDIWAFSDNDNLFIECKKYNPKYLYLEDHSGGGTGEGAQEQVRRYFKDYPEFKWGMLTDGATFRLYYNSEDPTFEDLYLEISLLDIIDSTDKNPYELQLLIDILSPNSKVRSLNPEDVFGLSNKHISKIVKCLEKHPKGLKTTMKAFCVAALEDMGIRPSHHSGMKSIRQVKNIRDYNLIFASILSDDSDFHTGKEFISNSLCEDIYGIFQSMTEVDFYHIDHSFFGTVYQKSINNGNASHYTNSELSKELANYIANRSDKSQGRVTPIRLGKNDFLLDPALGSGQLLRGLLPFHKVFFGGRTRGIKGWRELAKHFIGRDIDEDALWIAKINIWLSTSVKGEPFIKIENFKKLNVLKSTINRGAGRSIKEAFCIPVDKNVVGCVSNPPWDALKGDKRRELVYDKKEADSIKRSLGLDSQQLNYGQIFLKIIHLLGLECPSMRFSIILPDNIFIDQNDSLRNSIRSNIDFYFSYPRNCHPITKKKIFSDVDATRKFGILFGRSQTKFKKILNYPYGKGKPITLTRDLEVIGKFRVFPLFSHHVEAKIIQNWKKLVVRYPKWFKGEFDPSLWDRNQDRIASTTGNHAVIGGDTFCSNILAWSQPVDPAKVWKRFSAISPADIDKKSKDRVIFSDYINNSAKKNNSSFLSSASNCNVKDAILYSYECDRTDCFVLDSAVYSIFVDCYATSQHMSKWRLEAIGLPAKKVYPDAFEASLSLIEDLELSLEESMTLYSLSEEWLALSVSKEEWAMRVGELVASEEEIQEILKEISIEELEALFAKEA
jgi:hypothetical protein